MTRSSTHVLKVFALICAFFGLSPALSPALAQSFADYPQARIETYEVRGETAPEIFASINRNAPGMIHSGQAAHAYAMSQFHWFTYPDGDRCVVELSLDLAVVFPAHSNPSNLSNEAWAWWEDYRRALEQHEAGHLKIAYDIYPALLVALESGPCETANARGQRVLDELERRQAIYDQVTDHGARTAPAYGR